MNDLYQEFLLEESRHPFGYGELASFTHEHRCENPSCGDMFSLQLQKKGDDIIDIAWNGQGCALSRAAASVVARAAKERGSLWVQALQPTEVWSLLHLETVAPARQKCVWLMAHCLQSVLQETDKESL